MLQLIVLIVLAFSLYKAVKAHSDGDDDVQRLATVAAMFCAMLMYFMAMP